MKVFLAGTGAIKDTKKLKNADYILESFYSIKPHQIPLIQQCKMFLLDSGAFTFMNNTKKGNGVDWKSYIDRYVDFINKHDVKYFFELDIDVIVGHENVKKIRKYIEQRTSKKCIPVWHKSRGLEEFVRLCKEYGYISIGGLVTKEIKIGEYKYLSKLIEIAHENNCKIHGLGFTGLAKLSKYHFDSVDSTTWLNGERFGEIHLFKNGTIEKHAGAKRGMRVKRDVKANEHNLQEWIKFQKYADAHL